MNTPSSTLESRAALPAVIGLDLDGVIWRGREAIAGSGAAVERLRAAGHRCVFLTNNSFRTVDEVLDRLAQAGIVAPAADVVGSAHAAAEVVAQLCDPGARVMVAGGPGIIEALNARGYDAVTDGPADALVVGWHPDFDYQKLTAAMRVVRAGAQFVATNRDPTLPTEHDLLPGGGSIVAAITVASGVEPVVAGKPEAPLARLILERFGTDGLMVGDQPTTDGALAGRLDWPFALVLSGVTEVAPPTGAAYVAADLASLTDVLLAAPAT